MLERVRPSQFDRIAGEWSHLVGRTAASHPFLSHAWLQNWLEAFGTSEHEILLVRDRGEPVGGWVASVRSGGLVALEDHTYWPEFLHVGDESFAHALRVLADSRIRRLDLQGPRDAMWRAGLERAAASRYLVIEKSAWSMRHIELQGSLEDYLRTRDGKVRTELRRKVRRFGERFPNHELRAYGPDDATGAFAVIDAVERDSWKSEAGTAIVSSEHERRFYRGVLGLPASCARPTVYACFDRGEPISYLLGLHHCDAFHALKTSYRSQWSEVSPGLVVLMLVLERLGREGGVRRVELLGRDSRWKREVATGTSERCVYQLMAQDVSARLYSIARQHVRPLLQRIAQAKEDT